VYRDLKPENIGFDVRGDVKIFDFGLARQLPNEKDDDGTYKMTGDTGSARYMAPEIAMFQPYNETVDVYSFGILLHQILSLEKPFDGFTAKMIDKMVMRGGQRPKCDPKWPPRITSLLQGCWNVDISKRPAMRQVLETLSEELSQYSTDSMQVRGDADVSGKTQHSLHMRRNESSRFRLKGSSSKSSLPSVR
jgi:serine/threonine protein kinase